MTERKRAQNVIDAHYTAWNESALVFLDMACGSGKTTFILNTYAPYLQQQGKKMLYLCNRIPLYNQLFAKIKEKNLMDTVTLLTYQTLENKYLLKYKESDFDDYDVFVCDECHYFLSDALFNENTEYSFEFIMSQNQKIVLMMSATIKNIKKYTLDYMYHRQQERKKTVQPENDLDLQIDFQRTYTYAIQPEYDYIDRIYWYSRKEHLIRILKELLRETESTGDKIIYFCSAISTMRDIQQEFKCSTYEKDILYLASDNVNERFINKGTLTEELNGYTFNERLLISTKRFDNGIDLADNRIKYIICDITDLESAVQSVGRKRIIDSNDRIKALYIMNYSRDTIMRAYKATDRQYQELMMYKDDYPAWKAKYGRNRRYSHPCLYVNDEGHRSVNLLAEKQLEINYSSYKKIFDSECDYMQQFYSYVEAFNQVQWLYYDLQEKEKGSCNAELITFLESCIGDKLYSDQIDQLKNICEPLIPKDELGRSRKGKQAVANYIGRLGYVLTASRDYKKGQRGSTYWIISKE